MRGLYLYERKGEKRRAYAAYEERGEHREEDVTPRRRDSTSTRAATHSLPATDSVCLAGPPSGITVLPI